MSGHPARDMLIRFDDWPHYSRTQYSAYSVLPILSMRPNMLLGGKENMSQSASQASSFYKEVADTKKVWTLRDYGGFPAPMNSEGKRSQPFWSSLSRVQKIINDVSAYSSFEPVEISWEDFSKKWVPGLSHEGVLVGVNWSGSRATGYDIEPETIRENVESYIATEY